MPDGGYRHAGALAFPPLEPRQQRDLRSALGPRVALANPLDYHTYIWGDEDALTRAFTAMMQGDLAMGCVVLDFPRADRCDARAWEPVIAAVARTGAAMRRPMAVVASLGESLPEAVAVRLVEMGIVPFHGMDEALRAMEIAAFVGRARAAPEPLLAPPAGSGGRALTEAEAKCALSAKGVRTPRAARARSAEAAVRAGARIGFPVALKGEGIAHKTEAGAVALDLANARTLAEAARAMPASSFLVEEMIAATVAELLIGVVADRAHGYVMTLAAGGVLSELLEDSVSLLVPAGREDVRAALDKLRVARLLAGYRGKPAANIEAILDTVMAVQAYVAAALPLEIEINPLMCGPREAIAADALITLGDPT